MPLKLYQRRDEGIWHYRGTIEGERLRGTTGLQSKAEAEKFIIKFQAERIEQAQGRKRRGEDLTFAKAALLYRQAGKPERFLDTIEKYWEDKPVDKINAGLVRKAALDLYPKAKNATRNRQVIVTTQAVINHAADMDLCHPLRVRRLKTDTRIRTPATWEWVQAFMAHTSSNMGALCCFMFLTGARVSEALDVRWQDVNLATHKVLIRQTKVGSERLAHMPPELMKSVMAIEGPRDASLRVFGITSRHNLKTQWEGAIRRAGIERLTCHCCRHGFATTLLHRGVDPITVARLGGWKDAQLVFRTYGHAMQDDTLSNMLTDTNNDTHKVVKLANSNGNKRIKDL